MRYIFILLAQLAAYHVLAVPITGKVVERQANNTTPMYGVNVYWKGTTVGTSTLADGTFRLERTTETDTLVTSFVGYKTIEVVISNQKELVLQMEVNNALHEVVVFKKAQGSYFNMLDPIQSEKLTGAELHKAACCNLAESFETNPSVDVSYSDAVTGAKQIKLLGLAGIYSQYQTDNMPNLKGLATNYALTYIPGPWMESISVSKGAASVQNGYESITGQINVEYKKPDDEELAYLNLFSTFDGYMEVNANTNAHINENWSTGLLVHGNLLNQRIDNNSDGFMDTPLKNNMHVMNRWKYHKGDLMTQFGINLLHEERTGGQTTYQRGMAKGTDQPYGVEVDANRAEAFLKGGYVFSNEHTSMAFLGNYIYHELNSAYGLQDYTGQEHNVNARLVVTQLLDENGFHNLNTGASFMLNTIDETYGQNPQAEVQRFKKDEQVPGVFAEYTFKPTQSFTLLAGIRADFHNLFGTFYTPRVHVRYQPLPSLTLRASAGKGYRTANLIAENSHLLANSRTPSYPEQNYFQEEAWNYGISALQKFTVNNRELVLSAEFYRTEFQEQMVVDMENSATEILFYALDGQSFANSLQVDVRYEILKNLDLTLAYRHNNIQQTIGGALLEKPFTSRYKGLITLNYATNLKKWMFDYTVQLNGGGRMPLTPGTPEEYQVPAEFAPFTIMNAQVTRYFKHWNIYLGSENLADFRQDMPVISADNPYGPSFDATKVYGPTVGRRIYAGVRISINRD